MIALLRVAVLPWLAASQYPASTITIGGDSFQLEAAQWDSQMNNGVRSVNNQQILANAIGRMYNELMANILAIKAETDKIAAVKIETDKIAGVKSETDKIAAVKTETDKTALIKAETDKIAAVKSETDKVAAVKAETDKIALIKAETDKITAVKSETDKIAAVKVETDKVALIKAETDKIAGIKNNTDKIDEVKSETDKIAGVKSETDMIASVKAETDQIALMKAETDKIAGMKISTDKIDAVKSETDKIAGVKSDTDMIASVKAETDQIALIKAETDEISSVKSETDKIDAVKSETDKIAGVKLEMSSFSETSGEWAKKIDDVLTMLGSLKGSGTKLIGEDVAQVLNVTSLSGSLILILVCFMVLLALVTLQKQCMVDDMKFFCVLFTTAAILILSALVLRSHDLLFFSTMFTSWLSFLAWWKRRNSFAPAAQNKETELKEAISMLQSGDNRTQGIHYRGGHFDIEAASQKAGADEADRHVQQQNAAISNAILRSLPESQRDVAEASERQEEVVPFAVVELELTRTPPGLNETLQRGLSEYWHQTEGGAKVIVHRWQFAAVMSSLVAIGMVLRNSIMIVAPDLLCRVMAIIENTSRTSVKPGGRRELQIGGGSSSSSHAPPLSPNDPGIECDDEDHHGVVPALRECADIGSEWLSLTQVKYTFLHLPVPSSLCDTSSSGAQTVKSAPAALGL